MKTRTTIILAFLGLSLLGGANFTKAQTISNYALVCFDDEEEEEIEFSVTGVDPEGPVVVSSGTTSFTVNNIVIRNNFEVTSGASLRVGN